MANDLARGDGTEAAEAALAQADVDAGDVDTLIFVSTTVLRSPNLDVTLAGELGLRRDVRRIPIFGLASLGGATALGLAADLVNGGDGVVLIVAAEMNSLMFVPGDASMESLVTLALFSDGAAAAVVRENVGHLEQHRDHRSLFDARARLARRDGLRRDRSRPALALGPGCARPGAWRGPADSVEEALAEVRWKVDDLDHLLVHPGGTKVLDAVEEALDLAPGRLAWSRRDHA